MQTLSGHSHAHAAVGQMYAWLKDGRMPPGLSSFTDDPSKPGLSGNASGAGVASPVVFLVREGYREGTMVLAVDPLRAGTEDSLHSPNSQERTSKVSTSFQPSLRILTIVCSCYLQPLALSTPDLRLTLWLLTGSDSFDLITVAGRLKG